MRPFRLLAIAAAAAAGLMAGLRPAAAMPPFAQAYGVKCTVCHTMVPALNTYGRAAKWSRRRAA